MLWCTHASVSMWWTHSELTCYLHTADVPCVMDRHSLLTSLSPPICLSVGQETPDPWLKRDLFYCPIDVTHIDDKPLGIAR